MQNVSIEDTIIVVRNFLRVGNINGAIENLQIIMDSTNINEKHELIIDILNIRILMELGQTEEAVALMEASSYGLTSERFKTEFVEIQTLKAILYFLSSKFDESELILSKTLTEIEKFNETDKNLCDESFSELSNLHGLMFSNAGDWDAALTEFQTALSFRKRSNHRKEIGVVLYNIANVYRYQQNPQLSISTLEEGVRTLKDIDHVEGLEASYKAIRDIYTEMGESDSAFSYKQKLDELSEKIKFKNYVKETTISKNTQAREIERLNAEIIQNKQEVWSLKLELNSTHDAKHDGESFSAQIVDKTKEELDEAQKLIRSLQQENAVFQTKIESQTQKEHPNSEIENQLSASLLEIKTLTEQANHNIKEIESLNILVDKKKSETDEMQNVIKEYLGKIQSLEGESVSKSKELETLKEELKVNTVSKGDVSTELQKAKEKIAELQIELEDKDLEMKKRLDKSGASGKDSEELKQATQKIATLEKELENQGLELKKVSEQVDLVGKDFEELEQATQKIVELQNALETKDALIIKLGQKNKSSESNSEELVKANEEIFQLQADLKDKDIQMEENLKQIEVTFEELDALKAKLKTSEIKASGADRESSSDDTSAEISKELKASRLENEVLERQIKDIEAKHKVDLQNTIEEMKKVSQNVSESSLGNQVESLTKEVQDLQNTIKQKNVQIDNFKSKFNELNYQIEAKGLELKKLKSENEGLVDKTSKIDEYKIQIEELKAVQASPISEKPISSHVSYQSSSSPPSIQDYLDSSKLAESIAAILENHDSLKLRFLAMQIGTSPAKCMAEIKTLREIGFVDLEYDSAGDSNPLIVKK